MFVQGGRVLRALTSPYRSVQLIHLCDRSPETQNVHHYSICPNVMEEVHMIPRHHFTLCLFFLYISFFFLFSLLRYFSYFLFGVLFFVFFNLSLFFLQCFPYFRGVYLVIFSFFFLIHFTSVQCFFSLFFVFFADSPPFFFNIFLFSVSFN